MVCSGYSMKSPRLVACYGRILVRSPPCPVWQVGEGGSPALDAVTIMTELSSEVEQRPDDAMRRSFLISRWSSV